MAPGPQGPVLLLPSSDVSRGPGRRVRPRPLTGGQIPGNTLLEPAASREAGCGVGWPGGLLAAGLLLRSQLVPNPLQGHSAHEEGDGKVTLVPIPVIIHVLLKIFT